jgi:hypothetical protein
LLVKAVGLITHGFLVAVGVAAFATLAVGASALFAGAAKKPHMTTVQLSGDPAVVAGIVQGDENRRAVERLRTQLLVDYLFIAFYWLTYLGLAVAIARRGGAGWNVLGLLAALLASGTALLDVTENVRTRGVLALTRPGDQVRRQPVVHLRLTSLAKWAASAATVAVLSLLFLPGRGFVFWLGIAFLAAALVGFAALYWNRLVPLYFFGFCAVGVAVAVSFTFATDQVLQRL